MNLAEHAIKNKVVGWLVILILVGGGFTAYERMAKLEDPEFTVKEAQIITLYPGASPEEVRSEVTYHVEEAVQQMDQLRRIKQSTSRAGASEVKLEFKKKYRKADFPAIYDELRRKIADMQHKLPPGALPPMIIDDFADVYGVYIALTGEGYTYRDLEDYADLLKQELVLVPGVRKVVIAGEREEVVYLEISRARLAELGISLGSIQQVLQSQNVVAEAGNVRVGDEFVRIEPTGQFKSVAAIGDLLISSDEKKLIYLKDIATVTRAYDDVPTHLIYQGGRPALTLGISMASGENVVAVGQRIDARLRKLVGVTPVGMQVRAIYDQPKVVDASVRGFIVSVLQALGIVIVVLLVFMGLRTGLIIGAVLLVTVAGTLWVMDMYGIALQRISLGALIIALGMLVDNAIVVAEGMLVRIKAGIPALTAGGEVISQTQWALLGGTIVGILAFSPIGLSDDSTGEFAGSLFWVILISLLLSWLTAVHTTPLLCALLLKPDKAASGAQEKDPYAGVIFRTYRRLLEAALRYRRVTVGVVLGLFALAIFGFGFVKNAFFPDSSTPMFFVDLWEVEGTDIRKTRDDLLLVDAFLREQDGVVSTLALAGKGATRFTLVYGPESQSDAYGQIIVQTDVLERIPQLQEKVHAFVAENLPDSESRIKPLRLGPGRDSKIEARFSGPDPEVLRAGSNEAQRIFYEDGGAIDIRDDWRQPVKLIKPIFNEQVARQLGITREHLSAALQTATEGSQVGVYRDGIHLLPIVVRAPEQERIDVSSLRDVQVYSPVLEQTVPVAQVVRGFETVWENAMLRARNRALTITPSCNPADGLTTVLFERLRPKIEAMELPPGYKLEWGGEYEDQSEAQASLFARLPGGFLLMILTVILLFGKLRQPLIIWLTVPLAIIGITAGLLLFNGAFDFMAMLGALSLIGLLIKNAIVLIEQIDLEIEGGKERYLAIVDSAVSRMRPVMMAASTTILGLIPLLPDVFFRNMAITMMFGLGFATILTLVVVPVLYAVFFRVPAATVRS